MALVEPLKVKGPHEHDCWIKKTTGWGYYWRGEFMRKATPEEVHLIESLGPVVSVDEPELEMKIARQTLHLAQNYNIGTVEAMHLLVAANALAAKSVALGIKEIRLKINT